MLGNVNHPNHGVGKSLGIPFDPAQVPWFGLMGCLNPPAPKLNA